MKCPFCSHNEDRVLETREQQNGDLIRRRRECLSCKTRFSTTETVSFHFPQVLKKDGRRESFEKSKLLRGIQAACSKRPISPIQIENLVDQLSSWAVSQGEKQIPSKIIGIKVMKELRLLDDVAYVRFASVYRIFKDVQEFVETLDPEI